MSNGVASSFIPSPVYHCPPPDPTDLPVLRQHLSASHSKLRALVMAVASTGRRANDVRLMRWQDVRLGDRLWLYRPGRHLTLSLSTCAAIRTLPEAGPWVFPLSWRRTEHPWSEDAVEKSWERFRRGLPGALRFLTLTGLRTGRDAWLKHEQADASLPSEAVGLPLHLHQRVPDLSDVMARLRQDSPQSINTGLRLEELAELYFQYQLVGKPSYETARRLFYKEFADWLERPVAGIKKIEIIEWHSSRRLKPFQANGGLTLLRTIYNWGIRSDVLTCQNPTALVRKFTTHSRARAVGPDEMPKLIWAIQTAPPRDRAFFLTCLLTAARGIEVRHMEWDKVDLLQRKWIKPHTKNGRPHLLPLPRQVIEALTTLPRTSRWVFPGVAGEPISKCTPRKAWCAIRQIAGIPDVTVHDLRRSAASWMASRNVNMSIIQHTLNHVSLSHTSVYARLHTETLDTTLQTMANEMTQPTQETAGLIEQVPKTSEADDEPPDSAAGGGETSPHSQDSAIQEWPG